MYPINTQQNPIKSIAYYIKYHITDKSIASITSHIHVYPCIIITLPQTDIDLEEKTRV